MTISHISCAWQVIWGLFNNEKLNYGNLGMYKLLKQQGNIRLMCGVSWSNSDLYEKEWDVLLLIVSIHIISFLPTVSTSDASAFPFHSPFFYVVANCFRRIFPFFVVVRLPLTFFCFSLNGKFGDQLQ